MFEEADLIHRYRKRRNFLKWPGASNQKGFFLLPPSPWRTIALCRTAKRSAASKTGVPPLPGPWPDPDACWSVLCANPSLPGGIVLVPAGELIPELVQRLQGGDSQVAAELFARYVRGLTRLAERHLGRRLAERVGGEDVVQSAFHTFFPCAARGAFRIDSSAQLGRLLVTLTLRKARTHVRHHTAERRDAAGEQLGGDPWLSGAVAHEPGPDEAAALVDLIEALIRDLPAPYGQVLESRLQGESVAEVAAQRGVSRQTMYRALNLLQRRLADRASEP
jgi:RNA polymerase sigma-70 factor, ECF subfamily